MTSRANARPPRGTSSASASLTLTSVAASTWRAASVLTVSMSSTCKLSRTMSSGYLFTMLITFGSCVSYSTRLLSSCQRVSTTSRTLPSALMEREICMSWKPCCWRRKLRCSPSSARRPPGRDASSMAEASIWTRTVCTYSMRHLTWQKIGRSVRRQRGRRWPRNPIVTGITIRRGVSSARASRATLRRYGQSQRRPQRRLQLVQGDDPLELGRQLPVATNHEEPGLRVDPPLRRCIDGNLADALTQLLEPVGLDVDEDRLILLLPV